MNRREFLEISGQAVAAAMASSLPVSPMSPVAQAAPADAALPAFANGRHELFITWMGAAKNYFDGHIKRIFEKDGIMAKDYNRVLRSLDNTKKSWRTMLPAEVENLPAMRAMLTIYDAEMQALRDITADKNPDEKLSANDFSNAIEITRSAWNSVEKIAGLYPELRSITRQVESAWEKWKREEWLKSHRNADEDKIQEDKQIPSSSNSVKNLLDKKTPHSVSEEPNVAMLSAETLEVFEKINKLLAEIGLENKSLGRER